MQLQKHTVIYTQIFTVVHKERNVATFLPCHMGTNSNTHRDNNTLIFTHVTNTYYKVIFTHTYIYMIHTNSMPNYLQQLFTKLIHVRSLYSVWLITIGERLVPLPENTLIEYCFVIFVLF